MWWRRLAFALADENTLAWLAVVGLALLGAILAAEAGWKK